MAPLLVLFVTILTSSITFASSAEARSKRTQIVGDERDRYQDSTAQAINKAKLICSGQADPAYYVMQSSEVFVDKSGPQPALVFHYDYRPEQNRIIVEVVTTADFKKILSVVTHQQTWRRTYNGSLVDPIPKDGFVTDVTVTCQPSPQAMSSNVRGSP